MSKFLGLEKISDDDQRRYGWEYGIRRTDFQKDKYHKLLCKEEQAVCIGKLLRIVQLDRMLDRIDIIQIHYRFCFRICVKLVLALTLSILLS